MALSHLSGLYKKNSLSLNLDLYHLTMAYGFWRSGIHERPAIFTLFYRKQPFKSNFAVAAGLHLVIDFLQHLKFTVEDIQYLGKLNGANGEPLFDITFLNYLQRLEFSCDVDAVSEGTFVQPNIPLIRVEGPLLQAQIIESALLNLINFSTLIATKAALIRQAAGSDSVLEFGLRRAQGLDGGVTAARSAFIGGCDATSNVLAGKVYQIPVKGTHAHSWVMCFESELESFEAYAAAMPNNCIFLVDTYDTEEGIKNAIQVGLKLREQGHELLGVRLDSGNLADLSKTARKLLDEGGFPNAAVVASDSLDELTLKALKEKGAVITVWGIGTRLVTGGNQSALGGVYKLGAIQDENGKWDKTIKLSENPIKVSNPGKLQVMRYFKPDGIPEGDLLFDELDGVPEPEGEDYFSGQKKAFSGPRSERLLQAVFRSGRLVFPLEQHLAEIRTRTMEHLAFWPEASLELPLVLESSLAAMKKKLIEEAKTGT